MMYRCMDCGHLFEEGEEKYHKEYYSAWGEDFSTEEKCCPVCGGTYEEMYLCPICNERYVPEGEYVCEDCLKEHYTFENLFEFYKSMRNDFIDFLIDYKTEDFFDIIENALTGRTPPRKAIEDFLAYIACCDDNIEDFKKWLGDKNGV